MHRCLHHKIKLLYAATKCSIGSYDRLSNTSLSHGGSAKCGKVERGGCSTMQTFSLFCLLQMRSILQDWCSLATFHGVSQCIKILLLWSWVRVLINVHEFSRSESNSTKNFPVLQCRKIIHLHHSNNPDEKHFNCYRCIITITPLAEVRCYVWYFYWPWRRRM